MNDHTFLQYADLLRTPPQTNFTNITEHRAPTDESVRLLAEFEKAANDKILKAQKLDNNLVSAMLWTMLEVHSFKKNFAILVSINGEKIKVEFSLDTTMLSEQEVFEKIYEKLSETICSKLMGDVIKDFKSPRQF